jgi:hypothetical protein
MLMLVVPDNPSSTFTLFNEMGPEAGNAIMVFRKQ